MNTCVFLIFGKDTNRNNMGRKKFLSLQNQILKI